MTKNFPYLILILLVVLTIFFIRSSGVESSPQAKDELKIVDSTYLIGESPNKNSTNVQLYSYKYSLYNAGDEQVNIDSVEPLFKKDFLVRLQ